MADYSDKDTKRKAENIAFAEPDNTSEDKTASLKPPSSPLGPSQAPIQKKEPETTSKDEKSEDKGVDVDIKVLPPSVQVAFWRFKMSADTGKAKLNYKQDDFGANLGYKYGSALSLGLSKGPLSGKAAYTPGASDFSLGMDYKKGDFNAGLSANPLGKSASLSLGIGSPLLPMPDAFGGAMQKGGDAATNMIGLGPMAPLNDPMAYYKSNKDSIGDVSKAAGMASKLAKEGKGISFGAGVRLSASQLGGFTIGGGIQGNF